MIGNLGARLSGSLNFGADLGASVDLAATVSTAATLAISAATAPAPAVVPLGAHPPDVWSAFKFIVEIEGVSAMRFKNVGAISVIGTPEHAQQGGRPGPGDQLPPLSWKWSDLSLSRGMAKDGVALWRWVMDTVSKKRLVPHNITVTLLDAEGKPGMVWTFLKAYPKEWTLPTFDASEGKLAIETIKFAHQGASLQFAGGSYQNTGAPPPPPKTPPSPTSPASGGQGASGGQAKPSGAGAGAGTTGNK
ncbi:MAG: phage tail protein [Chloroflexi bacterium]|nr:phage tail protein [Chloroflexota bacterium]